MSGGTDAIKNYKVIDNKTIPISGNYTTPLAQVINLSNIKAEGNITLQIEVTGVGVLKVEWLQSNNWDPSNKTGDFVRPVSGFQIVTGFGSTSGTDLDGKDLLNVPAFNSEALKFYVEETGGAATATINAWVSIQ